MYFPFTSETYTQTMGTRPLGDRGLVEIDTPHYDAEIALKAQILASDLRYYAQALPYSEPAQWDMIELLLPDLAARHPERFGLSVEGDVWRWHNLRSGDVTVFQLGAPADLPHMPIDWLGRQIQEDLILMSGDAASGCPLIAGQLCFGSSWSLDDKIGLSFLDIHEPVPQFNAQLGRPANLLMERLKLGRPVWRLNWSIKSNARLNAAPRFRAEDLASKRHIALENVGERCFLRVERQALARLPRTGAILFTIHTYNYAMSEVCADAARAAMLAGFLQTTPEPMLRYKGVLPFYEPLLVYLERASGLAERTA